MWTSMNKKIIALLLLTLGTSIDFYPIIKTRTSAYKGFNTPLGTLGVKGTYEDEMEEKTLLTIIAISLAIKIGYDYSWQGVYSAEVENTFSRFLSYVYTNDINSLHDQNLYNFFKSVDPDFCLNYEAWLRNSYDSWLKPWNWTASQKSAYEKIEILSMIALHGPIITCEESIVEKILTKHARKCCSAVSEYPLVYYGCQLDLHLAAIKKGFSVKIPQIQKFLLELEQELNNIKYLLRSNPDYITECQTLKTHQLLHQVAASS